MSASAESRPPRDNPFIGSPLVAFLRTIHRAQATDPASINIPAEDTRGLPSEPQAEGNASFNAESIAAIVDALKSLRAAQQPDGNENVSSYEKSQRHFSELAAKLNEHAVAVRRRLGSATEDQPVLHALHQTLHLNCRPGGIARGLFRCDNKTGRTAHVDLRVRGLRRGDEPCPDAAIAIAPSRARLAADERGPFAVEVDLRRCGEIAEATLTTSIDLYLNERLALRLFARVDVQAVSKEAAPAQGQTVVELHDIDDTTLRLLRSIQNALLNHPMAFQAAFSALIAEGKRFESTPEGAAMKSRLEGSDLLHQLRHVFDLSTFSLLERDAPTALPSAYFDTLFMLAASENSDEILDRLFQGLSPK